MIGYILLDLHVDVRNDGSVHISLPGAKTHFDIRGKVVILGQDAEVVRLWITHRRELRFPDDPGYLFVTKEGWPVNNGSITQMLYVLGNCAGYGPKFFSSHSFRTGYANTVAAEFMAAGRSEWEVGLHLGDGEPCAPGSNAAQRYISPQIASFFRDGYRMSFAEFEELGPTDLHDLASMYPR